MFVPTEVQLQKLTALVESLRAVSDDKDLAGIRIYIPSECEEHGYVEGRYELGKLLHFAADMIEQ